MLRDFVEIRAQQICELGYFSSHIVVEFGKSKALLQFIDQVDGNIREIVDEVEGFFISCAIPAVSWPSEASFSVWTSRSCAARSSSSECESSLVRSCTCSNNRTFSIAMAAWSAKL